MKVLRVVFRHDHTFCKTPYLTICKDYEISEKQNTVNFKTPMCATPECMVELKQLHMEVLDVDN